MSFDAWATLIILALTFAALLKSKIPVAAVFAAALTAAITLKLAPLPMLLKGFSNEGMLTVAVLFIVAAGMYSTGAVGRIVNALIGSSSRNFSVLLKMLPGIAIGSAFLNNTPLVAMMIPVIRDLAKNARLAVGYIYIPLSFASILGGTCTMIGTSTNLIIAGLAADALAGNNGIKGLREIRMFDTALPGIPITLAGIAFLIIFAKVLLPANRQKKSGNLRLRCYSAEFKIQEDSPFTDKKLSETGMLNTPDLEIVHVERDGLHLEIDTDPKLKTDDRLVFTAGLEVLTDLWRYNAVIPHHTGELKQDRHDHMLVSAVVSGRSFATGRRVKDIPTPESPYQFRVVALSRDGDCMNKPLEEVHIATGDQVILEVDDTFLYESQLEKDFTLTKLLKGCYLHRTHKSLWAGIITVVMIMSVAFQMITMLNAALLASAAMLVTGCLSLRVAARSVDWQTLLVIACSIGLGNAVTESGLADEIAKLIIQMGADSTYAALAAIFAGASLMTNIITNNAAAAFMFPIALSAAGRMDVNAMPFIVVLMISASCAFISPTGYQTNLMVWEPGGYAFSDFVKIGIPLTLITGILTIVLVPIFFNF